MDETNLDENEENLLLETDDENSNPVGVALGLELDNTTNETDATNRQKTMTDTNLIENKLESIQQQLEHLYQEFQIKIRDDAQKEVIIDRLHQELQGYRENALKKHFKTTVMDIISVVDGIRKTTNHYRSQDPDEHNPEKLLNLLENIPSELEDLLDLQGIQPFTFTDNAFDPVRQKTIKKIKSSEREKNRTVAESLRPGYEWDGHILRREMVAVYIYEGDTQ